MSLSATQPDDFFEGREKLLEVWFRVPSQHVILGAKHPSARVGLRQIARDDVERMLALVKCTILGVMSNDYIDSYVLSESSLFISPYRLILKTCGQTTLLAALPLIIQLAADVGLPEVEELFYSRHAFMEPTKQLYPHESFSQEVSYMQDRFQRGHSMELGDKDDSWFLYTLDRPLQLAAPDQTLELMMHDLDPTAMAPFYKADLAAADVTQQTGIVDIIPKANIHEFLFEPCGYSCNALIEDSYYTIHITPQPEFSYVSFETDYPTDCYKGIIKRVLAIFKPGRFSVSLFANDAAVCGTAQDALNDHVFKGYTRQDEAVQQLHHYTLKFGHYLRDKDTASNGSDDQKYSN
eukprot:m.12493 g.12493  ORF g.12493 m.12493 type:complete len:351 (-) comp9962_c0_seq1:99-1151(-)